MLGGLVEEFADEFANERRKFREQLWGPEEDSEMVCEASDCEDYEEA